MNNITSDEAQKLIQAGGITVLDVRTPAEFAGGHIAGAVNIDIYDDSFAEKVRVLPAEDTYIVVCRSGGRSSQACSFMNELRFTKVLNLEGGMMGWGAQGLPMGK